MSFSTKSYAERLTAAIAASDKQTDPEQAVVIMKRALLAEIKTVNAIANMPAFRAWIEGERFDMLSIRARSKS